MDLTTIIRQARNGELKNLSEIDKTDEVIVDYINMAMVAIYGRFQLDVEEAIITMRAGKTIYTLDGTDVDVQMNGTVLQIVQAFDELGSVPINDDTNDASIYTISYDTVQIPVTEDGAYISIIYKKEPTEIPFVDSGDGTATNQTVRLPRALLEPMLHYIGYRAHGSLDGNINTENNTHLMRFERSCQKAEELGMVPADTWSRDVSKKGFV